MLEGAAQLALAHKTKPVQGKHLKDVHALMDEAAEVEPNFHAATRQLIESAGGRLQQGPLKKIERVIEKMENDYEGDHRRVVDIVRDTVSSFSFSLASPVCAPSPRNLTLPKPNTRACSRRRRICS